MPKSQPSAPGGAVRLNKFLASCGVGSRRGVEKFIAEGRVEINGSIVVDLSRRVEPGDHVRFDGRLLRSDSPLTIVLNKPKGYLSTRDDPEGRKTLYELLPRKFSTLKHVGRLDFASCGLILLTNTGSLSERLTHPKHHVEKEYFVLLERPFDRNLTDKLLDGIHLHEGLAKADRITHDSRRKIRLVLTQGYNRQIRRMFAKLDYKVRHLERTRIGSFEDPDLKSGDYRILNQREIELACLNPS